MASKASHGMSQDINGRLDAINIALDDLQKERHATLQTLINEYVGNARGERRRYALLQAASMILSMHTGETYSAVVDAAEKILAEIERREQQ